MPGSVAEAEDVVQDAHVRWQRADHPGIEVPAGWLTTGVSRVCIDAQRSARMRREQYVGPWLHEAFDYAYHEIAAIVGKSEAACRQLVRRAKQRLAGGLGGARLSVASAPAPQMARLLLARPGCNGAFIATVT